MRLDYMLEIRHHSKFGSLASMNAQREIYFFGKLPLQGSHTLCQPVRKVGLQRTF